MKISDSDILAAAREYNIDPVDLAALIEVEAQGSGYLADGRLKILYEPHLFHRLTDGRHGTVKPISAPSWSVTREWGYGSFAEQYRRRAEAAKLDRDAAYQACSYGAFQLLGSNFRAAGYDNVFALVDDLQDSPRNQLRAILRWMQAEGILQHLRDRNMPAFFSRYNGPAWREHDYGGRFGVARRKHADRFEDVDLPDSGSETPAIEAWSWDASDRPIIRKGDSGSAVRDLQTALDITADGIFGPVTEAAVRDFQRRHSLAVDGIVGPRTWAALERKQAPPDPPTEQHVDNPDPAPAGFFNAIRRFWIWLTTAR